jgi:hypothetical protein
MSSMPKRQRFEVEAQARQRRCAIGRETSAKNCRGASVAMSRRHRRAAGASLRRRHFIYTSPATPALVGCLLYGIKVDQPRAENPDYVHGRAMRSKAWAVRSSLLIRSIRINSEKEKHLTTY